VYGGVERSPGQKKFYLPAKEKNRDKGEEKKQKGVERE
jgi:hypothetical protein